MHRSFRFLVAVSPLSLAASGCGLFLGIDDFTDAPPTGGGGTTSSGGGGTGGTTSTTDTGGTGGTTTSSGGGGTGGGTVCNPNEQKKCYEGPPETENKGICTFGISTCEPDGSAWGPCKGQVLPQPAELCATPEDDDCDGVANPSDTCCEPNMAVTCYGGPPGTQDVGQCKSGTLLCPASGELPPPGSCQGQVLPADEFCGAPDDEDCNGHNCWVWSFTKGGLGLEYASSVAAHPFTHEVVVGGAFNGSVDLGGGLLQGSAGTAADAFLAAYSKDGAHLWSKGFGKDAQEILLDTSVSGTAGIAIVGNYSDGDTDFGGGSLGVAQATDGFVARLDAMGDHVWSQKIGGAGSEQAWSVKHVADGILVAGSFSSTVISLGSGAGTGSLSAFGGVDVFLAKFDAMDGALKWVVGIGGPGNDGTTTTSGTMDGDVALGHAYVAGTRGPGSSFLVGTLGVSGTGNFFLARVGTSGAPVWAKSYSVSGQLFHVAAAPLAGPYLAGTIDGTSTFGSIPLSASGMDIAVVAHTEDGNVTWTQVFGGPGDQRLVSAAADQNGLVIGGLYDTAFTLGTTTLPAPSLPGGGAFVARLDTAGNVLWVHPLGAVPEVAIDTLGFTLIAGGFTDVANFGGGAVTSAGNLDVFVGKLGR